MIATVGKRLKWWQCEHSYCPRAAYMRHRGIFTVRQQPSQSLALYMNSEFEANIQIAGPVTYQLPFRKLFSDYLPKCRGIWAEIVVE